MAIEFQSQVSEARKCPRAHPGGFRVRGKMALAF